MINAQFIPTGDTNALIITMIILSVLSFVGLFVFPRLMALHIITRLEQKANEYEMLSTRAKRMFLNRVPNRSSRVIKDSLNRFANFFVIEPVSLDPAGVVRKIEHILEMSEDRYKYFIDNIAPHRDSEEKANMIMGIKGVVGVNYLSKIVRHFVETIKKTKNLQLAMVLQMQMPFIEKIIKSQYAGTEAMLKGQPVGDSIGPYMAATLLDKEGKEIDRDVLMAERTYKGHKLYVMKARGPGGRLGRLGRAVERIMKKNKISKIITIDAGLKFEGEKTGTVAEGVGIAIGGIGVEKSQIEDLAVKYGIPMDSIVVKMGMDEAIEPMRQVILDTEEEVIRAFESAIDRSPKNSKIIVIGVGNTVGVGNKRSDLKETREMVKEIEKKAKKKEAEEKKREQSFFGFKKKEEEPEEEW